VGVDGTILTKVDADVKGGSALSVTYVTGKPIMFIGVGQTYEDLQPFEPEQFTQMILR
jgi:fused signal recognition particle receptor